MNPYSYTNGNLHYNTTLLETTPVWKRYAVDFPTTHPTRYEKNNTVRGEYFLPQGITQAPLAILVHGMGDYGAIPCKFLARTLAKKGIPSFVLYQVFHSTRMPDTVRDRFYHLSQEEWFESYQISVVDIRQVIDWADTRPEINKEQISVIGISFGGMVSSIAMGVDRRIQAGVFLVSGGNASKMMWLGTRYKNKFKTYSEAEYYELQNQYKSFLAEVAEKGWDKADPPQLNFLTDAMTYAHLLRQRPVLMINALWDRAVPREATLDFWEECGRPTLNWFPATHPTLWVWYPFITRKIVAFLNSTFRLSPLR